MGNRIVSISIPEELLRWLDDLAASEYKPRSALIMEALRLLKAKRESSNSRLVAGSQTLKLDKSDLRLLHDIMEMYGGIDEEQTLKRSILLTHILLKAGIWQFLKPLPEIAKVIEHERKT